MAVLTLPLLGVFRVFISTIGLVPAAAALLVCNLPAGNCNITVTDLNGCTETASASISEPTELTATTSASDAFCTGFNGTASISASGGTPPYISAYSGGPTTFTLTGLYYGVYTAEVAMQMGVQSLVLLR